MLIGDDCIPSKKSRIFTEDAPLPVGPYSQAIRAGDFLFVAGQVPVDPTTGDFVLGSITNQTQRVMDNIKLILEAAGASLNDVVRTTIYLTNMQDFNDVNEAYGNYFDLVPPARSTIGVADLPKGVAIEIDVIAYHPEK
ncbi:MAG: RidA family protein [Candidatus Hodarchaeota archaeon]